jgi:hypothetical protein
VSEVVVESIAVVDAVTACTARRAGQPGPQSRFGSFGTARAARAAMLRGRAGALALVPPVEPVGVAPLIDVEDALPLVRKALRSRVHLKAWHSRLCEPSEACRSEVHSFFSANGNALLPFNLGLKQITTRLPLLLKCAASEPVALVDVGAGIHGLAPWYKLHATSPSTSRRSMRLQKRCRCRCCT